MLKRQMPLLTTEEQEKFKNTKITVIGCGGLGGMVIEMLVRMGVGELVVVDEDVFDVSNLNRQILSTRSNIGCEKSEEALKRIHKISPHVRVSRFCEHVDESNVDGFLEGSRLVIDCLDNIPARVTVSRKAREYKIPFVHGAVSGTLGQVTTFLPNTISYEEMFMLPSLKKELTCDIYESLESISISAPPVIGPVANLVSCVQAMEAFKIVTRMGKVTVAPKILTFDLLDLNSFSVGEI